jgi:hypothetical protein
MQAQKNARFRMKVRFCKFGLCLLLASELMLPVYATEDAEEAVSAPPQGEMQSQEPGVVAPLDDSVTTDGQADSEENNAEPLQTESKPKPAKKIKNPVTTKSVSDESVAADAAAVETPKPVQIPAGAEISQGEKISIEGKGFAIQPPVGWIIQRDHPRLSLMIMAPVAENQYPPNISVVRFPGPMLISKDSAEKFAEKIIKGFTSASSTLQGYSLRSSEPVKLADGRDALLFYTDYQDGERKMMQAHVLASSKTNHYLLSYTDVAENFVSGSEGSSSQVFNNAWSSMVSLELDSGNPEPAKTVTIALAVIAAIAVLWFTVAFIRNRRAAAQYRQFTDMSPRSQEDGDFMSSVGDVRLGDDKSLEPTLMTSPQSDSPALTSEPLASDPISDAPGRGKKLKLGKRNPGASYFQSVEDFEFKATEVSSIEFSNDKFKRGA